MKIARAVPVPAAHYAFVDGSAVFLDFRDGSYVGTNRLGTEIFSFLLESPDVESLLQYLLTVYEVDEEQLRADVRQHLRELERQGIVRLEAPEARHDETAAPISSPPIHPVETGPASEASDGEHEPSNTGEDLDAGSTRGRSVAAKPLVDREGRKPIFLTMWMFLFFLMVDIGFGVFGFERVYRWVMRRSRAHPTRQPDGQTDRLVRKTFRAVLGATTIYYRKQKDCLPRALAVYYHLRRKRIPAEFRLGVKRFPFAGHAWVTYRGQIIDISPDIASDYTLLSSPGRNESPGSQPGRGIMPRPCTPARQAAEVPETRSSTAVEAP